MGYCKIGTVKGMIDYKAWKVVAMEFDEEENE